MLDIAAILTGVVVGLVIMVLCFTNKSSAWPCARELRPKPPKMPKCKPPKKSFHEVYAVVGCPKCGQQHRYGLDREYLDCYLCSYTFDPELEGRRYESYKKENQ